MARILIVTDELHPFTAGGIGRLTHNLLAQYSGRHAMHVLMPTRRRIAHAAMKQVFGERVVLHEVELPSRGGDRVQRESLAIKAAIEDLHRRERFDFVELPDFFGWGFALLSDPARRGPRVAVRLHGSRGVIAAAIDAALDGQDRAIIAQERFAVQHADIRVAHLPRVARALAEHFDVPSSSVQVSFPPVVWPPPPPSRFEKHTAPDFFFLSKIERVKNPELFIDGCALFFTRNPTHPGNAVLACHAFEADYLAQIKARVPPQLSRRFIFRAPLTDAERPALRGHVVVVPSIFETLNLLAFEALAVGAAVCLNGACPAFVDPPWTDEHCLKFTTPEDLCRALERVVFEDVKLSSAVPPAQRQYWD